MSDIKTASGCTPLMGQARLMTMAEAGVDLAPIGQRLLERARAETADANALMDLQTVLQLMGQPDAALAVQGEALAMQQIYRLPVANGEPGIRLLALMGPGDFMANTPLDFLIAESDVALDMLYVGPDLPLPSTLPEHDVLFVALGESDEHGALLSALDEGLRDWPKPVLNRPEATRWLARDAAAARLADAPGINMPVSQRLDRAALKRVGSGDVGLPSIFAGGDFPVIIRPLGSHAGRGLAKLNRADDVADYLSAASEDRFYVTRFIDYRSADKLYRKYRVVFIDGRAYACHMGISAHWMIHYLNAGMADSADKRAEEARFMAGFDTDFALRHAPALRAISERMQLDYLVIDCAETLDGQLLVFELDTGAVVHAMDSIEIFPYKKPQMHKVFVAFRQMLADAISRHPPP